MVKSFFLRLFILGMFLGITMSAFMPSLLAADFDEANLSYAEGNFEEAAEMYLDLNSRREAPEIYYNLANAYFEMGELGLSILYYEKALKLRPRESDARSNLKYANKFIEYEAEDTRNWAARFFSGVLQYVTISESLAVLLSFYLLLISTSLIGLIRTGQFRLGNFGVMLLTFTLIASGSVAGKYYSVRVRTQAIVVDGETEVRYGPSRNDRLAFRLPEGLKVVVRDQKSDWVRVELLDGQNGWSHVSGMAVI